MTSTVECYLIGGPLNGKRGPIAGDAHSVKLNVYKPGTTEVDSVEVYVLGDIPTLTFRYWKASEAPKPAINTGWISNA